MKKLIITTIFVAIALAVSVFIYNKVWQKKVQPALQVSSWQGLTPGTTTKEQVVAKLGAPKEESGNTDTFNSTSPTRPHEVVFSGNAAVFFKEIVTKKDNKTIEDVRNQYGVAPYTLYGPDAPNGDYLFVYPDKGVAYLGNPETGELLEIWYFPTTTLDKFMSSWATDYSKTPTTQF